MKTPYIIRFIKTNWKLWLHRKYMARREAEKETARKEFIRQNMGKIKTLMQKTEDVVPNPMDMARVMTRPFEKTDE